MRPTSEAISTSEAVDGAIQLAIDAITERLAELGLNLSIERDFNELRRLFDTVGLFANPTFDPQAVDLGPDDFWLLLRAPDGEPVGWSAERIFENDDIAELIRSGRIWARAGFGEGIDGARLDEAFPRSFTHSGSTFVHEAWRGQGLSMLLTYLSRGLGFRNSRALVNTGFVREHLKNSPVPTRSYGYPHLTLCWDGHFPPLAKADRIHLCWIDRHEFAASCRLLPEHDRYPVALPEARPGPVDEVQDVPDRATIP